VPDQEDSLHTKSIVSSISSQMGSRRPSAASQLDRRSSSASIDRRPSHDLGRAPSFGGRRPSHDLGRAPSFGGRRPSSLHASGFGRRMSSSIHDSRVDEEGPDYGEGFELGDDHHAAEWQE